MKDYSKMAQLHDQWKEIYSDLTSKGIDPREVAPATISFFEKVSRGVDPGSTDALKSEINDMTSNMYRLQMAEDFNQKVKNFTDQVKMDLATNKMRSGDESFLGDYGQGLSSKKDSIAEQLIGGGNMIAKAQGLDTIPRRRVSPMVDSLGMMLARGGR